MDVPSEDAAKRVGPPVLPVNVDLHLCAKRAGGGSLIISLPP